MSNWKNIINMVGYFLGAVVIVVTSPIWFIPWFLNKMVDD